MSPVPEYAQDYMADAWPLVATGSLYITLYSGAFKYFSEALNGASISAGEATKALSAATMSPEQVEAERIRRVKEQEETNAKWRPWFDSLTDNEKLVIATTCSPSEKTLTRDENNHITGFSKMPTLKNNHWEKLKETLRWPQNWLTILLREIPALKTPFPVWGLLLPCGCQGGILGGEYVDDVWVTYPYQIVIHLNDTHSWTYDNIADWLDTLGLDLTFRNPYDNVREDPQPN